MFPAVAAVVPAGEQQDGEAPKSGVAAADAAEANEEEGHGWDTQRGGDEGGVELVLLRDEEGNKTASVEFDAAAGEQHLGVGLENDTCCCCYSWPSPRLQLLLPEPPNCQRRRKMDSGNRGDPAAAEA